MMIQVINGIMMAMLASVASQAGSPFVMGFSRIGIREMAG